ncbi:MSMEG_0567/Sll0786 family nitrogen starvation N-acetyltransferase [Gymnodinialimonas sp. 2305UL16-5]|uniref:MSMEG_0567/Sll0786 family nitrogen starvation N-acetyltransferase n=1 Tax=Gymnodinialimonas mytili TaxID=3126503 RepID=UPI0030A513EC
MSFHSPLPSSTTYVVKLADCAAEHQAASALRRTVFCDEQELFESDDHDAVDAYATTIVALTSDAQVVGTVRIHEEAPHLWWGSRLAVARPYRRVAQLGAALIRCAVSTANAHGCDRFLAHVQIQNEPLFQKLRWASLAYEVHHGIEHVKMQADLAAYPPGMDPLSADKPLMAAE